MRLGPVIALLQAALPGKKVLGAVEYARDLNDQQFTALVYVVPLTIRGGENGVVNGHRQVFTHRFGVIVSARTTNNPGGGTAADPIEDLRDIVMQAIVGITPEGHDLAIRFAAGALLPFVGDAARWQDEFDTTTQFRRV